jgi:hypothetical protein
VRCSISRSRSIVCMGYNKGKPMRL